MEIRDIKLSDIRPYEANAKLHSDEQIEAIANSIKEFGTAIFKRHEFYVYSTVGNIKVIRPVDRTKEPKTPTLSHTPNAIYATVRSDGVPKQVTVYGPDREKMYDIDLDHNHSTNPSFFDACALLRPTRKS